MILFVTAYDDATMPNLSVAQHLARGSYQIFEDNATRDMLWSILNLAADMSLFAMSHGRRQFLRAQHGTLPHAVTVDDHATLGSRRVFAWACLTSAELGVEAARAGTIWFGFPVRIAAPPDHPRLQTLLAEVLQIVVDGLNGVHDEPTCRALLDQLVQKADHALLEIEKMRDSNELPESAFDSVVQQCFEQFQLRLEAWLPGFDTPIRPTRAPQKRYDDLDPARDLS